LKAWRPVPFAIAAIAAVVFALLAVAFFQPAVKGVVGFAGRMAGYNLSYSDVSNREGWLTFEHPDVSSRSGEPVLTAERLALRYNLRDLFGSPHPYGISAVVVQRPKLTVIHHPDGTYNIALPQNTSRAPSKPMALPQIHVHVENGSIGLIDDTRIFAHSRRMALQKIAVDANLDPRRRSTFTLACTLLEEGGQFPLSGRGTLDQTRGYEYSRITARSIGLAPLMDYALNSRSLHVANGVLNRVDARFYGLPDRSGAMQRHISVTANLDHFQPYLNGLAKPLRAGRGALRVFDDGIAIPKVDGSIAGVPVRIAGAVYDLAQPTLRLGITGTGELRRLLTLNDVAKNLPLDGPVAFRLLVEGHATSPATLAAFTSPGVVYAGFPIDGPHGLVALSGPDTTLVRSRFAYAGIDVAARGNFRVEGRHTGVDLLAGVDAPAQRIPYAAALVGPMLLHADAVVSGLDIKVATRGILTGANDAQRLAAAFAVDPSGVGTVGPLTLEGPGERRLYARVALDRPRGGGGAAFVSTQGYRLSTLGNQPALPGIHLPPLPPLEANVDGDLAVAFANKRYLAGGDFHATSVRALGYALSDVSGRARIGDGLRAAVEARYRGPLAELVPGRIAAVRGTADIPISIVANGATDALVQVHDARFEGASIARVPLEALEATIGVRGSAYDVYAGRARLGGNDIVAQGSFGNGGTLQVSGDAIALAPFRALGLPLRSGTLTAVADIGGSAGAPRVGGGFAASDVRFANAAVAGLPVSGNSALTFADGKLTLYDALVRAGPAVGTFDGSVTGLGGNPKSTRYAFDAHVRQADVATLARLASAPLRYPEGTLDADLRVAGSGNSPSLDGTLAIPEGSLNGLRFRDASVALSGTPSDVRARGGRLTVGSTSLGFDGAFTRGLQSIAVRAPALELADFNDAFDRGDTLGGAGSAFVTLRNSPQTFATSGRVRLEHTRFRRFEIGTTRADWSTAGRNVAADLALGSTAGRLSARGTIGLPATQPLRNTLYRSNLGLEGRAERVNLGIWLPAAGIAAPVLGFVDAAASIRGTYPAAAIVAHADLKGGMVQRVAVRTATLDARAAGGRATIGKAVLAIDNFSAGATGTLGLRPHAPLDLTVTAASDNVAALATTLTGAHYDAGGAVRTTLHLTGTMQHPLGSDVLDAQALRYGRYDVPRAHAELAVAPTRATLQRAEVDLRNGRVLVNGFVPLQFKLGYRIAPPTAPLALRFTAENIDLAQFADLLPKGNAITGLLDGDVGIGGSLARPSLSGTLLLANGSFVGPEEKAKISSVAAQLTFDGRSATLHDTSADVGGGTVAATGHLSVPSFADPARDAAYDLRVTAANAVFNLPQYFRGRVNGTLNVARTPSMTPLLGGSLALSSARVPTSALTQSKSATATTAATSPAVDFNVAVAVGRDVRVQGGPVDIGAQGDIVLSGNLAAPALSGQLESTGGTISFYRTFRLQDPSTLVFDPSNGIIPEVDATATTTVDNPFTDVTLHVTGLSSSLNVALQSDPNYSREQILGLLVGAQALGAVSGVQTTANGGSQTNPFQALAAGQLGTLLTQNILEPLSAQIGGAVGLSSLALNYNPGGSVSIGARKRIFKNVSVVFAESFNYPQRQSIGLLASPNDATALQLTFFSQPSSNRFDTFQGANSLQSSNNSVTSVQPANGASGFSFSFQRKFP